MTSWIDDIVRCPAHFVNTTNATNSSNASLLVPRGGDTLDLHNLSTLVRALLEVEDHDGDGAASHSTAHDLFPFASTTILYGLLALEALVFCVWCAWKLRGLLVFAASRGGGSNPSAVGVNNNSMSTPVRGSRYGSIFQSDGAAPKNSTFTRIFGGNRSRSDSIGSPLVVNGDRGEEAGPIRIRLVTKSTDNTVWAFYFGSVVLLRLIATGTLVFAANYSDDGHEEALRIALLVQRVVHGVSCVWLAVALNIQRLYRVKDHKNAKANQALLRQATFINRFCFVTFLLFSVGDFITSHIVSAASAAADALFWVSIGALLLLAVPTVLSTFWVVLHESQMQPTRLAKSMLILGVVMHTVVELPPAFWNDHLLASFVDSNPCPLTYLSFYDMILVGQCVTAALLFAFVVLEHRRTSTIVHLDYLAFCDDRLYRRLAKDGTLPKQPLLNNASASSKPPLGPGGGRSGKGAAVKFRQHSITSTAHSMSTVNTPKHPREEGEEADGFVRSEQLDDSMFDDDGLVPQNQGQDDDGEFMSEPTMMESDFARMANGAVDEDVGEIGMF
jgi:hypothetical protein